VKRFSIVLVVAILGCEANQQTDVAQDESLIKGEIQEFHRILKKAYNGGGVNTDSLYDTYFDKDSYYVTAWGISEPIDSTKKRLRSAIRHIKDYENRVEIMSTKVMGNGGYVFFVLRQNYRNDGTLVEEYLPTTFVMERRQEAWVVIHAQRSTDYETMQQWVQLQKMREEQDKKAK
jgi:hypothetical protein